jgi:hypothetical protein
MPVDVSDGVARRRLVIVCSDLRVHPYGCNKGCNTGLYSCTFCYSNGITLVLSNHVCVNDPGAHMRCIRFSL